MALVTHQMQVNKPLISGYFIVIMSLAKMCFYIQYVISIYYGNPDISKHYNMIVAILVLGVNSSEVL